MRRILLYIVLLIVGAGAGLGGWMLVTNPKMQIAQTQIDDLKAQLQESQEKAEAEMTKMKLDLGRSRGDMARAATEMRRLQTENTLLKKALERVKNPEPEEQTAQADQTPATTETTATTPVVVRSRPVIKPKTTATVSAPAPAGTRDYIIQDGDSFWKIAANQLGNGARYKEIVELNPPMTEKSKLEIGKTIKIPAK